MNNWNISGRIGRDAELRQTPSGKAVANFTVAVDQRKGSEKSTLWVDCAIWEKRAEALAQYLTKATVVSVAGEAGVRTYQAKDGATRAVLTLNVREVTLLGGGQRVERPAAERAAPASAPAASAPTHDFDDSEIPFNLPAHEPA